MKNKIPLFVGALALFVAFNGAKAAPITWGTASAISGDSNVIAPSGSLILVQADRFSYDGYYGTATVNGVAFTSDALYNAPLVSGSPNNQQTFTNGSFTVTFQGSQDNVNAPFTAGLSTQMGYLLFGGTYTNNYNGNVTIGGQLTFNNLTIGTTYVADIFASNTNNGGTTLETLSLDGTPGNSVTFSQGTTTAIGSYVTATFTANSTTETIDYTSPYDATINAVELLQAVPEPSTVALLSAACGLVGLVAVRRFRLAAV